VVISTGFFMSDFYFYSVLLNCKFGQMKETFDKKAFKERLEAQTSFPTLYMFKFIVPNGSEAQVAGLLPNNKMTLKHSSKGTYVSATIKAMMPNSEAILDIYEKAAKIEGVISL